jgi:hypothetical protein
VHNETVVAQPRNKGLCLPMTKRFPQALSSKHPATQPCHLGRGRRLVEKDQPVRLFARARLSGQPPASAYLAYVIASAFRCHQRFFYN